MTDVSQWVVMLVDDEPDSLDLVHDILALNGAHVQRAASGDEFLAQLAHTTPDLVVLDLNMPHPDGWALLEAVRSQPHSAAAKVVAITAYHSPQVASEAQRAGFDAFIPKPIKSGDFLAVLQGIMG